MLHWAEPTSRRKRLQLPDVNYHVKVTAGKVMNNSITHHTMLHKAAQKDLPDMRKFPFTPKITSLSNNTMTEPLFMYVCGGMTSDLIHCTIRSLHSAHIT